MSLKQCAVSFTDVRGIRHSADVEAESLYEAAVEGIRRLNQDPWIERIGPGTKLEIDVRDPPVKHVLSVEQVERWLAGATKNPTEATKKKNWMGKPSYFPALTSATILSASFGLTAHVESLMRH